MSDHLLRLARIVAHIVSDTYDWKDVRVDDAAQLVHDIEAAPQPERRTITRYELDRLKYSLQTAGVQDSDLHADAILSILRLTVEDA